MKRSTILLLAAGLSACAPWGSERPPAPAPEIRFTVGSPYQTGGVWQYPQAAFSGTFTGLATVMPDRTGLTADGETFDQTALTAGHRTLQLPAVVRVTTLDTGREVLVRLNDRGPENPARLISLSKRAAELLAMTGDGARVRVQVVEDQSRLLAVSLQGGAPDLTVASAPRGEVQTETLALPEGATQEASVRQAAARAAPAVASAGTAVDVVPLRLPEQVVQGYPGPGELYIALGTFSSAGAASIAANRLGWLGARVTTSFTTPRERAYRVRIGPLYDVPSADATLQRALSAGVPDAAIIVE